MKELLWNWLPALVLMGVIFVASDQSQLPSVSERWLDIVIKKGGHMLGYGLLASLYIRALKPHIGSSARLRWLSWGLAVGYALTDEYHQCFVPGRNGTIVDVGIDGVGAGISILLQRWLQRRGSRDRRESGVQ